MKRSLWGLAVVAVLGSGAGQASAGTLWYNGDPDGVNSYFNQNDPVGGTQIVYNDFRVPGSGWLINSVWSNNIFLAGPPASTNATWEIRSNMPTGTLVASGDAPATLTPTGFTVLANPEYQVLVSGLNVSLAAGTYWLAVYPDDTNGSGVANDTTSGANAVGFPPGNNGNSFFSFDGGTTFEDTSIRATSFDTSAGVGGSAVPLPSTLATCSILFGTLAIVWTCGRVACKAAPTGRDSIAQGERSEALG